MPFVSYSLFELVRWNDLVKIDVRVFVVVESLVSLASECGKILHIQCPPKVCSPPIKFSKNEYKSKNIY